MSAESQFDALKELDVDSAASEFRVFRHSSTDKLFSSHFVPVSPDLLKEVKGAAAYFQSQVSEHSPYGILDEPNESGALTLDLSETNFSHLETALNVPAQECMLTKVMRLNSASGYVLKVALPQDGYAYFIKKVHASWSTKAERNFISALFNEQELALASDKVFYISKSFDFVAIGGHAFIQKKRSFESLLKFKGHYEAEFSALTNEAEFTGLFSDFSIIADYVGTNSIQLRRMAVIKERQHYKDASFMTKVQELSAAHPQWGISFDDDGKIGISSNNVRAVVQCLLDLRLKSEFSGRYYDAQFATAL
ncbi:Kiwa anti-phage protein KwaB-like domain-containing protein [Luteimonas fraxinea]|uniref:Kiwa anti-phage protein KwaB-like domain-containing protein n=1 Tax=Luteimonas fraxinea TaxID=2901869 RepID=UPI001E4DB8E2|nr:Kiwa anti-phage protein KwaB-like domain-containing protein [Luteimonas fraxinea]MCD9126391.1 DUF4868 domain-containing protein [Luteimonas fraxinea]